MSPAAFRVLASATLPLRVCDKEPSGRCPTPTYVRIAHPLKVAHLEHGSVFRVEGLNGAANERRLSNG